MEPDRGMTATERDFARLGAQAATMPRSSTAPVSNDVLARLANSLNAVYEEIDAVRAMLQRSRIIDVNLMREPEGADVANEPSSLDPSLPSLAEDAIGRCQQVREGLTILDNYHNELGGVLTRIERKLFGEGPF